MKTTRVVFSVHVSRPAASGPQKTTRVVFCGLNGSGLHDALSSEHWPRWPRIPCDPKPETLGYPRGFLVFGHSIDRIQPGLLMKGDGH